MLHKQRCICKKCQKNLLDRRDVRWILRYRPFDTSYFHFLKTTGDAISARFFTHNMKGIWRLIIILMHLTIKLVKMHEVSKFTYLQNKKFYQNKHKLLGCFRYRDLAIFLSFTKMCAQFSHKFFYCWRILWTFTF